jgi:hypothetical protein
METPTGDATAGIQANGFVDSVNSEAATGPESTATENNSPN